MAKKTTSNLIFIDTNIFLDFYRMRDNVVRIEYLKNIENIKEMLIQTYQVEMEYKKNRQAVIIESVNKLKPSDSFNVPVFVSDFKPAKMISELHKQIKEQQVKINKKVVMTLENPTANDTVYQSLQRLFKNKTNYYLEKDSEDYESVYKGAKSRFELGYPPRKKNDNSFGDAINWEWIIKCANKAKQNEDIIIVSRDSDYGSTYKDNVYLNDWLNQEFKQRVSQKRKITITRSLASVFKDLNLTVSKEMEKEEKNVIQEKNALHAQCFDIDD